MCGLKKILLYINTIKYLKMTQIWHQIDRRLLYGYRKRRLKQVRKLHAAKTPPVKILIPALDLDDAYLARFQLEELLENKVEILHEKHIVDLTKWNVEEASHLWNYNLQYLEFLIPLAAACGDGKEDRFWQKWCEYADAWMRYPSRDSFEPYTISMRIPNLLICMNLLRERIRGSELEKRLTDSIYQQYQYLLMTQELALLANHYFENLKTIIICSVMFEKNENYRRFFSKFYKQVEEQILPDGLHYERSLMYHKIILEDILRIYIVLEDRAEAEKLLPVIEKMASSLSSVSRSFPRTPLFNDAGDNVAKDTDCLLRAVRAVTGYTASDQIQEFEASGYYKLYSGRNTLLFDCGEIGPSYMGGHAHCDCLSFELIRDEKLLFVNSGTGQYQGRLRSFFRSTMAHNTVMIDEREQSELWGEHRAARRISGLGCTVGNFFVSGKFQSFCGDCFARKIEMTEQKIKITDLIKAKDRKKHCARQFFHIASGFRYVEDAEQQISVWDGQTKLAVIYIPEGSKGMIHRKGDICSMAQDFGECKNKEVLEVRTPFKAEVEIQIYMKLQ